MSAAPDSASALDVLAHHGRTFHFASHLLGHQYRTRAARLYAFCRYADDLADRSTDPKQALSQLKSLTQALHEPNPSHPRIADMRALMGELSMPMAPVRALLDGACSDLSHRPMDSELALIHYAYQVAGTVGLMMCSVLDVKDPAAKPFAIDLGIAMQLTNIARDVGDDASIGRIYLPADWLGPMTPAQILDPNKAQSQALQSATRRVLDLAEVYYSSGLQGIYYLPRGARYGIVVAAVVYREIGRMVADRQYRSWDQRAVVPKRRKLWLAAQTLLGYGLRNRFRDRPGAHNRALHRGLEGCFGANVRQAA